MSAAAPPTAADPIQVRLARLDFRAAVYRDVAGAPWVSAEFVAEQGARIVVVDIRPEEELSGAFGWIPWSVNVPLPRVAELLRLGPGARVVLASAAGTRAGVAARFLELAGMSCVAALDGGVAGWRAAGLPTTTDGAVCAALPEDPDAVLLQPDRPAGPLTLAELEAHLEDPSKVRWIKLAAFQLHGKTACVDGRDSQSVVGTPGGDAGEFLLALGAAESLGQPIAAADLPGLLVDWVETFGRFYLHSDIHASNAFILAMRADPRIPEVRLPARDAPPDAWRAFTRGPHPEIRPAVLEHLVNPAHLGCGHLRLTLQHTEDYGVRRELAEAFLRAFWTLRWSGLPELEYVVLGGGHREGAVLLVTVEGELWPHSRVPLVPPGVRGVQTFVHHPQVTAAQREAVARWLADRAALPRLRGRAPEVAAALHALGERQLGGTLARLAAGLPIFEARFAGDRTVTARQLGEVGASDAG